MAGEAVPSWGALEARAAGCSFAVGISVAVVVSRLIVAKLELVDVLEACVKLCVLLSVILAENFLSNFIFEPFFFR
jgi:hypothetical protein